MNGNELLDKMSEVDGKLITEADNKPKSKRKKLFIGIPAGIGAAAAVIAAVIGVNSLSTPPVIWGDPQASGTTIVTDTPPAGSNDPSMSETSAVTDEAVTDGGEPTSDVTTEAVTTEQEVSTEDYSDLPILSLANYSLMGMGFEGYTAMDAAGLEDGCPWNENVKLETMPVYLSSSKEPDIEKMRERVRTAAKALGIAEEDLELTDDYNPGYPESYRQILIDLELPEDEIAAEMERVRHLQLMGTMVYGQAEGIKINLDTAYTLSIFLEPHIPLPEEYNFTDDATDEEKEKVAEYLLDRYKELIDIKNPAIRQRDDYNGLDVYDTSGDIRQQIVDFSLNHVDLCNYEGELWIIRIYSYDGCEKIGDYPIISADKAKEMLKEGKYLSSGRRLEEGEEPVRVEMAYRSGIGYTYVMPFYKFFVELKEFEDRDGKTYGAYYVPAVREEFIGDMSAQISFNGGMIG